MELTKSAENTTQNKNSLIEQIMKKREKPDSLTKLGEVNRSDHRN